MSDQTPDPHDELLRAALEAEASGVTADPALLEQIRRATAGRPPRRVAPWLLAAAAVVAVAGLAVVLLRDADQELDVTNDPSSTTTSTAGGEDLDGAIASLFDCAEGTIQLVVLTAPGTSESDHAAVAAALSPDGVPGTLTDHPPAEVLGLLEDDGLSPAGLQVGDVPTAWVASYTDPAAELEVRATVSDLPGVTATSSTNCLDDGTDPPPFGQPPTLVALVREDGWLVTVDVASGQQTELHFVGDPNESSDVEEGGPSFVDDVDLSPDGEWVYFSTCCEPAVGTTFRIPTEGGEVEQVAMGAHPRLSPDGRFVATGGSDMVIVTPIDGSTAEPATIEVTCCPRSLAWSPDGTQIAIIAASGPPGASSQALLFDWDGATLSERTTAEPYNPGWFVSWTPSGALNVSSGGPVDDDRSLSQDASYHWLLWVDEEGVVRQQAGHESGDRTILPDLPRALAADW